MEVPIRQTEKDCSPLNPDIGESRPCQDKDRETVEVPIRQTEKDCSPLNPDINECKGYTKTSPPQIMVKVLKADYWNNT